MSPHLADAYLALAIARIARSPTPTPDRTFIEGAIDMAEFLGQLTYQEAALYREALAIKAGDRAEKIRSAA